MTHLEVIQKVWPDWKVTEKIGEGSFGQVFKAEKESYGIKQESAIKVVRIPGDEAELEKVKSSFGLDDEELRDYFYPQLDKLKKEIELMMKLDDSHIVKIYDFEIKESLDSKIGWYMIIRMELLECLEKYVKNNDMTVADVVSIGEDILSCLETCEENNIIHRDIKPANLFRNEKGVYKLGDFGIAKDVSASVGSLSYKGTENYMAPEVYMGKRYNSTIDIYALGIVLYKLLNRNRLPFMSQEKLTSASIEKAFQKRNTGEPLPKPVQASDDLYEVIQMMSAFKPEDRFQTATVAKKVLTEYRRKAGEELKTVLDINNKERKTLDTQSSDKVLEKSIVKPDTIAEHAFKAGSEEHSYEGHKGTVDICMENTEASVQRSIFNESDNSEQADEYERNKTRSIYRQEEITSEKKEESKNEQFINETDRTIEKKKTKAPIVVGIIAVCTLVLAAVLFFVFNNDNSSKVTIAKEIYDNDSIFVIDTDKYEGKYIEYTTKLIVKGEFEERSGIYIGETRSNEPNGYGAFYYRREGKDEEGSFVSDIMLIGEWKYGNLVASEEKVKRRHLFNYEYNTGDKEKYEHILIGDWGVGDFVGNPEGTSYFKQTIKETGETSNKKFEGTWEVTNAGYDRLNGDWYYDGYLYFSGEFKDDKFYNGIVYDKYGKEIGKVIDGEKQMY